MCVGDLPSRNGLATWNSNAFPRWLGGVAIVLGVTGMVVGGVQFMFKLSTLSITIFVVIWNIFVLWITVMSVLAWRRAGLLAASLGPTPAR